MPVKLPCLPGPSMFCFQAAVLQQAGHLTQGAASLKQPDLNSAAVLLHYRLSGGLSLSHGRRAEEQERNIDEGSCILVISQEKTNTNLRKDLGCRQVKSGHCLYFQRIRNVSALPSSADGEHADRPWPFLSGIRGRKVILGRSGNSIGSLAGSEN